MATEPLDLILFAIASTGAFALATPSLLYPQTLRLLPKQPELLAPIRALSDDELPMLSVLVPARNESEWIARKLQQLVAMDYPRSKLEILVCSDGSTDGTAEIVKRWRDEGVALIEHAESRGKLAALYELAERARGELLMLTDVSTSMKADAPRRLVEALMRPGVGAATGRYVSDSAARAYWSHETDIKSLMASRGALLGVHGAAWVLRREELPCVPPDTLHDDFVLPMLIRASGKFISYVPTAHLIEVESPSLSHHYKRWRRISYGNLQLLSRWRHLLAPRYGRVALGLSAHKLLKSMSPISAIAIAASSSALLVRHSPVELFTRSNFIASATILASALLIISASRRLRHLIVIVSIAMAATLAGVARYTMKMEISWGTKQDEGLSLSAPATPPLAVRVTKRTLDVIGALGALIVFAPLMALIAVVIKLVDRGGPAIYSQERVCRARDGAETTFVMYKFRTMYVDAETRSGPVWAIDDDPRVTPIGKILRKCRLDELPQFWNVLKGEMSLVGPRPERQFFTAKLQDAIPLYDDRVAALKPGITGMAQINCAYDTSVDSVRNKLLYDLSYASNLYSFPLYMKTEISIILKTVVVALTGKGAK